MPKYRSSFFTFFFLPITLALVAMAVFSLWSLLHITSEHDISVLEHANNMRGIAAAAKLNVDIHSMQQSINDLLKEAEQHRLDESHAYKAYLKVVTQCAELDRRLRSLAESDANAGLQSREISQLRDDFSTYRNLVVMAADIISRDPARARTYLQKAETYYFAINEHSGKLVGILAEQGTMHSKEFNDEFKNISRKILAASNLILSLTLLLWFISAQRMTRQMSLLSSSLSELAELGFMKNPENIKKILTASPKNPMRTMAEAVMAFHYAIEARKRTEVELQKSEQRLRSITDSARDAILIMDPQGTISYWNPAAERIFGYRAEEALGSCIHNLIAPGRCLAVYHNVFSYFQRTVHYTATGSPLDLDARRKDGREISIALSLSVVSLNGEWHSVGIIRDISHRKNRETQLLEAKKAAEDASRAKDEVLEKLEQIVAARTAELQALNNEQNAILEATDRGIMLIRNRAIVRCNKKLEEILGYQPGELPGKSTRILYTGEEAYESVGREVYSRIVRGESNRLELRLIRKDGALFWARLSGMALDKKDLSKGIVCIIEDITKEWAAAEALRLAKEEAETTLRQKALLLEATEQQAKQLEKQAAEMETLTVKLLEKTAELEIVNEEQRALFDSATVGIVLIRDRHIVRCNKMLEDIFGYGHRELIGKTTRSWYGDAETFVEAGQEIARCLADSGLHRCERLLFRKDGTRFFARMTARPLNSRGASLELVGIIEDITVEYEAAEALKKAKEAAEAACQIKSDFLANMSHEIRTPLNAIIGMSHLAMKTGLTSRQRDYLEKIQRSGQHLLSIINDILDFSNIEASKIATERADFDLEQVLSKVAGFLNENAAGKKLELIFDIAPDVPYSLVGDSFRIGQILLNYGSNAVKFTERGEICISICVKERTATDLLLYFAVRDTGIGLTEEQRGQLFQSFQQGDMSISRKFGGTGLGLAINKRLATLMGGEVGVESEYGVGSTFWFSVRIGISAIQKHTLIPAADLRGCRALVVDDNENVRIVLHTMLQAMTFTVEDAPSGILAVQAVQQAANLGRPFKIIFLDWEMPVMDGIETARQINALGLAPAPHIIMLTAFGRNDARNLVDADGIHVVLTKPIVPSLLFDTTSRLLSGEWQKSHAIDSATDAVAFELEEKLVTIRGAHVLLVEDNEINQEVTSGLLKEAGLLVDMAENGQVALDMVRRTDYDLVFMDMQMPVMDGVSATAEIRRMPRYSALPIVAITANAMQQACDACIAAGMDDFIAKPIEPARLWAVLLKWVKPRSALLPGNQARRGESIQEIELPEEITGLDMAIGLHRALGKKSLYHSVLGKFLAKHQTTTEEIRRALADDDRITAGRLVHTVKGVSGSIGAAQLQACAADLEEVIRGGRSREETDASLLTFDTALTGLLLELKAKLPAEQRPAPATADKDALAPVCHELAKLLKDDDSTAVDLLDTHAAFLRAAFPQDFSSIEAAIRRYDFDSALAGLERVMKRRIEVSHE